MLTEILLILALIVLNGVLAMSELAVVSSRPARLRAMEGRGARMALALSENPGRFLSSVQIGITAVGILSGALAGDTLGQRLADWLVSGGPIAGGMDPAWAKMLGVGGVVVAITYVSLIVGELVPKQLALRNPEAVAARIAPMMVILSKVAAPVVWFLDISGRFVLRLLGQGGAGASRVTEEEVKGILDEARETGVIEADERELMTGVMRLSDRNARGLMTPRTEIEMLSLDALPDDLGADIERIARPRMLVADAMGEVAGIVRLSEIYRSLAAGEGLDLARLTREVPVVSERMGALAVIEVLRRSEDRMALVYDEYGQFEGIVTTADVLEAITGTEAGHEAEEPAILPRADGSLLVSGWMPADEFCDRMGLPRGLAGDYGTVAGLVLDRLGHMPVLGEVFETHGHRFEVIDMDGLRIDKVLVTPPPPAAEGAHGSEAG
ncbi:hemolysin family protein [Pseudogemmobacter sonorensis]|uniref:hemolysin family protein n=1 Tax=Pseudogemmobacter sonorensis TaxID=2989681 RepID=UPI0036C97937